MKRYTVTGYLDRKVIAYLFDGERELVDATDLQSHARTLLAVVRAADCEIQPVCALRGGVDSRERFLRKKW